MIEVSNLSFTYRRGARPALDGVTLSVGRGDFVGIIGESGAGKSTLGHCINGVVPHYYQGDYFGSVMVAGRDTFDCSLTDIAQVVGTVSQDVDGQMVAAVVEDELRYGLENFGVGAEEAAARIDRILAKLGIADLRARKIATLSGGQKQKVALAAVLVLEPEAVLLDEPTSELDPQSSRRIFELLRTLNDQGVTVIVVEQKVMLLCEYAKRLVVMDRGRIALEGSVEEALGQTDRLVELGVNCPRVALLSARLNERGVGDGRVAATVSQAKELVEEVLA